MADCDHCELEHSADLVKSMITVPELADLLGLEVERDKIHSPYNPDERTPSCHLYEDHFWDYSTGKGGDVIDLYMLLSPGLSFHSALSKLIHRAVKAGREPGDVEKGQPRVLEDFSEGLAALPEIGVPGARPPFVDQRKPTPFDDLHPPGDCRLDVYGNLLIPHADGGGVYGVKVRQPGGAKSAWPGSQFGHRLYHPGGWVNTEGGSWSPFATAVIAEGETDCWALEVAVGYRADVFALPSGAGTWRDAWLEDLKPFSIVWICMDNDRAGQQARDKLTSKIGYLRAEQLRVPPLFNDAREAILRGWKPELH